MNAAGSACTALNGSIINQTDMNSCQSEAATYPAGLKCLGYPKASVVTCDSGIVCKVP
jgi:hypothetical protein